MKIVKLPKSRRPTYYFLESFNNSTVVHISTRVDMSNVLAHREEQIADGCCAPSFVAYIVWAASRIIGRVPEANAGFHSGAIWPRVVFYEKVTAKVPVDKTDNGDRIAAICLIDDANNKSVAEIDAQIKFFRNSDTKDIPQLKNYFRIRELPILLAKWLSKLAFRRYDQKFASQGSFTVSSLGHKCVNDFYPIISTTTGFGIGAIQETPTVVDGQIIVRPVMQVSLSFDHRLLDGAISAEMLEALKDALEEFS